MASEVLVKKWKQWFGLLDANKDGVLCGQDAAVVSEKFSNMHHLRDEEKSKLCNDISKWFTEFIFRGHKDGITEKEFVEHLTEEFEDQNTFRDRMVNMTNVYYQFTDMRNDGRMSEEHFIINSKAFGHENEDHLKQVFQQMGPMDADGHITMQRLKDEWVAFFMSTDPQPVSNAVSRAIALGIDI